MYTHGGGFHGKALGFELVFKAAGFETVWLFDNNPAAQKGAARHFPRARQLGDVFDIHYPSYVDVFTAGFPCQPFSGAGAMRGANDPRYLLPHVIRIISEVRPRVVLLENVPGFRTGDDGFHFRYLLRSLAVMGYDAEWGRVRASHVGAPHERKRWCLVAYAPRERHMEPAARNTSPHPQWHNPAYQPTGTAVQHATVTGRQVLGNPYRIGQLQPQRSQQKLRRWIGNSSQEVGHPQSAGLAIRGNGSQENQSAPRQAQAYKPAAGLNRPSSLVRRRRNGIAQRPVGRDADGLSRQLVEHRWPAGQGPDQYHYEPSRQTIGTPERAENIEALGNAIVPQAFLPLANAIREWLEAEERNSS